MSWLIGTLAFIFGANVGSFLNVVILRGERGEKLGGRSYCDACKKTLGFRELIPIISFALQKGRCRACGAALSLQYPIVEGATGALFALAALSVLWSGATPSAPFFALALTLAFTAIAASIVIVVRDIRELIIPTGPLVVLFLVGIGALVWRGLIATDPIERVIADAGGAIAAAGILGALWKFSGGRWMGFGDVKLIAATSLAIGFPASIVAFLFSFWIGGGAALALLAARRASWGSALPFGPFIIIGAALALLYSGRALELAGFSAIFSL